MQELPINYDPSALAARAAAHQRRILLGCISTGVALVGLIGVLLFVFLRRDGNFDEVLAMLTWVFGSSVVFGGAILIGQLMWLRRLRTGVRAVGDGLAMILSAEGIEHATGAVRWDEVARVAAARGKPGHGYRLHVERTDGAGFDFPLEGLAILPGTLDSATRAYSAGRHGVDLSVVDD